MQGMHQQQVQRVRSKNVARERRRKQKRREEGRRVGKEREDEGRVERVEQVLVV